MKYFLYILSLITTAIAAWHLPVLNYVILMISLAVAFAAGGAIGRMMDIIEILDEAVFFQSPSLELMSRASEEIKSLRAQLAAAKLPEGWKAVPIQPTTKMIDEGAQRLVSWEEGCSWPESWSKLQVRAARNEAERVWRSMWLGAPQPPENE